MEASIQQNSDQDGWNGVYEGSAGLTLDGHPVTYEELCRHGLGHMVAGPDVVPGPHGAAETAMRPSQQPQAAPDTSVFFS